MPGYEEQIVERSVKANLSDLELRVCSAEDLIIQKFYAGRAKDWQDIEGILLAQRGKLDEAYFENWIIQFAEALEMPDKLIDYQRLVARVNNR